MEWMECHNPYFNRWFSAIPEEEYLEKITIVTILILIDGFLQYILDTESYLKGKSQSLF